MLYSMTGYGIGNISLSIGSLSIEIRTLNSKNLDLKTKTHAAFQSEELILKNSIGKSLIRGKVDAYINLERSTDMEAMELNVPLIKEYIAIFKDLSPNSDHLALAMKMPEVSKKSNLICDDSDWSKVRGLLKEVCDQVMGFRLQEGASIMKDLENCIRAIRKALDFVLHEDKKRVENIKIRLTEKLEELSVSIDKDRFEQELIYYIEKFAIDEEIQRLKQHMNLFEETLADNSAIAKGKKLGFISQEIGREINTLGSKSNWAPMQQQVVEMKNNLEQIKEQVLNCL